MRESLLGPSYFYHRQLVEQSKGWSQAEIRDYQDRHFRRLTQRYGHAVTQKEDYRREPRRYTHWDVPLMAHTVRTGGTTGQPLRFRADTFARRQKERAYLFDIWSQVGYRPHDLRVRYAGDIHGGLLQYRWLENVWDVSPAATTGDGLNTLQKWLNTLPPFFLHIYPSSLYTFIDLVGETLFRRLPIKGVIAASEGFLVGQRARFEKEFGLQVAHWYGHSEYAALAYCCRSCQGFHFYPTYGYVEFLPSEVEEGQRIVASSFNQIGTQFIRYDTGDLAVAPTESCANDHFPRAGAIMGRSQETFVDNSGLRRSLFGYAFGDLDHGSFWDMIQDLQFIQEKPGFLRLRIVTSPDADRNDIEKTFERRLSNMAVLKFEYVSSIDRSPSQKRRYFISYLLDYHPRNQVSARRSHNVKLSVRCNLS